jgi:glycosyltransferase involved in cell wall biosynthesis
MAEAMYLGVPVVATRWSGNLDFCKEETSYLVRAHLTPVKVRHAHLSGLKNATWSEPDAAHAAAHLRAIYEHPEEASAKARAARAEILALQQTYSYQNALQALAEGRTS